MMEKRTIGKNKAAIVLVILLDENKDDRLKKYIIHTLENISKVAKKVKKDNDNKMRWFLYTVLCEYYIGIADKSTKMKRATSSIRSHYKNCIYQKLSILIEEKWDK